MLGGYSRCRMESGVVVMTAAVMLGILAVAAQMLDKPSAPTNAIPDNLQSILQPYMPEEAYAGISVTGESLGYVGGVTWQTGKRWGCGAEYRQNDESVTLWGRAHRLKVHTGAAYLYRGLDLGDLTLRTEAGAGVLFTESKTIAMNKTWLASVRIRALFALTDRLHFYGWFGGVKIGGAAVRDSSGAGRTKTEDFVDVGAGLILRF